MVFVLNHGAHAGKNGGQEDIEEEPYTNVDYDGKVVRNPHVREQLQKLRVGITAEGHITPVKVTGGESYKKDGKSISLTTNKVVPGRKTNSAHNIENGARAVDISGKLGLDRTTVIKAIKKYTDFKIGPVYKDGHHHLRLPPGIFLRGQSPLMFLVLKMR